MQTCDLHKLKHHGIECPACHESRRASKFEKEIKELKATIHELKREVRGR